MSWGHSFSCLRITLVALSLYTGCGAVPIRGPQVEDKPTYGEFVSDCGSEGISSWLGQGGIVGEISADCSDVVGRVIGLDWASFSAEPHAFSIGENTTAEFVIAGALVDFATDKPTISDLLEGEPPLAFGDEMRKLSPRYDLAESDAAGLLWFALLRERIDEVHLDEDLESPMFYNRGAVSVRDLANADPDYYWETSPIYAAGVLVHEASHGFLHGHVACVTGPPACDIDIEGANGAEAWWRYRWLTQFRRHLDQDACEREVEPLDVSCRGISADMRTEFEACIRRDELCEVQTGSTGTPAPP